MAVKTDSAILADIVAAYTGPGDVVQWLAELRPILEHIKDSKINVDKLAAANGVATLNGSTKIPTSQLPSYVDDVEEYATVAAFPVTGETGKIYVVTTGADANKSYRWSGSVYVNISNPISALEDLSDVTGTTAAADGKILKKVGGVWTAADETGGGGAADSVQNHTSGATVTVTNGVNILHINPAATLSALEITLPATPHASNVLEIHFGGTMISGDVVTAISIVGNTGQTVLLAPPALSVIEAGEFVGLRFNTTLSKWYTKN